MSVPVIVENVICDFSLLAENICIRVYVRVSSHRFFLAFFGQLNYMFEPCEELRTTSSLAHRPSEVTLSCKTCCPPHRRISLMVYVRMYLCILPEEKGERVRHLSSQTSSSNSSRSARNEQQRRQWQLVPPPDVSPAFSIQPASVAAETLQQKLTDNYLSRR